MEQSANILPKIPKMNVEELPLPEKQDAAVSRMFARISGLYDFLNRVLSFGIDQSWRRALAEEATRDLPPQALVIDLAAGTLDVAIALANSAPGAQIHALDFCLPMLAKGIKKLGAEAGLARRILPLCGDAKQLPVRGCVADSLSMAFGIRNITPRAMAFAEMFRILKPGGRVCILEFASGQKQILGGIYNFYLRHFLPRLGSMVSRDSVAYAYLAQTITAFPHAEELAGEMQAAGFSNVRFRKLSGGIVNLHLAEKACQRSS